MPNLLAANAELDTAATETLIPAPAADQSIHLAGVFCGGGQANFRAELTEETSGRVLAEMNGNGHTKTWRGFRGRRVILAPGKALEATAINGFTAGARIYVLYHLAPRGGLQGDLLFARAEPTASYEEILPAPGAGSHYRIWLVATSAQTGNHVYEFRWVGDSTVQLRAGAQSGQPSYLPRFPNYQDVPENTAVEVHAALGGGTDASAQLYYTIERGHGGGALSGLGRRLQHARVAIPNSTWVDLVPVPAAGAIFLRLCSVEMPGNPWVEFRESVSNAAVASTDGGSFVPNRRIFRPNGIRIRPGRSLQARSRLGGAASTFAHAYYYILQGGPGMARNLEFAEVSPAVGGAFSSIVAAPGAGLRVRIWGVSASSALGNHEYRYRAIGDTEILFVVGSVTGQGASLELGEDWLDLPLNTGLEVQANIGGGAGALAGVHYTIERGGIA